MSIKKTHETCYTFFSVIFSNLFLPYKKSLRIVKVQLITRIDKFLIKLNELQHEQLAFPQRVN